MRITNRMLSDNFLSDMRVNLENMSNVQSQMTSGKQIRKPSDDPFKVARSMQLHSDIDANQQYNENIKDTTNWLDTTDTALGQAGDVLQRVRELLVSAGNGSYGVNERRAIKDEINQKIGEFGQILNTNFDGKYIFAGNRGTDKPIDTAVDSTTKNTKIFFSATAGGEVTSTNEMSMLKAKNSIEVSQGVTMEYNTNATDIIQFTSESGASCNMKDLFNNITSHLDTGDANLTKTDLQGITDSINNILKLRSEVGAKQNRMDSAQKKNEDESFNMTQILSGIEDIDITQKTMEYSVMQTVYTAALQTSAKVIQPSLLDYLR